MAVYLLLIIIVILFGIITIIKKDLFCPSSLLCMSYLVAIISTLYNIKTWRYNLNNNTIVIISIGIITFLITTLIQDIFRKKSRNIKKNKFKHDEINIKKDVIILLNIISFCIFCIYAYYFIKGIGGVTGFSNFSNVMKRYRFQLLEGEIEFIPTFVNLISKYCRALAFVSGYILISNLIYFKRNNQKIHNIYNYIISILIYIPFPLMTGSRFDLMAFLIYLVVLWYIIMKKYYNFKINISKFLKLSFITIAIVLVFSETRTLVGRDDDSDTISYVTTYFGGSIVMFDMYLQELHTEEQYFGQEIFSGSRKFLTQIHILDETSKNNTVGNFRVAPNGTIIGNVYTAFRKMYNDFGLYGIILFQIIMAIIFNKLYYSCLNYECKKAINTNIIIYSSLTFCLVFHSYSETFFSTVISFNYIVLFCIVFIISDLMVRLKIK